MRHTISSIAGVVILVASLCVLFGALLYVGLHINEILYLTRPNTLIDRGIVVHAVCCVPCESCHVRLGDGREVQVDDLVEVGNGVCHYSRRVNWELCVK